MLASPWPWIVACAIAGALAIWARRGRRPGHATCGRCGYDMTRASSLRCPECGAVAPDASALLARRPRRRIAVVATIVFLACAVGAGRAALRSGWQYALLPTWKVADRVAYSEGVVLETLEVRNPAAAYAGRRLRATRDGATLFRLEGDHFVIGAALKAYGLSAAAGPTLPDVNADGRGDIVVVRSTGGAGGGATTFIYSLGPMDAHSAEPITILQQPCRFEQLDASGALELVVSDPTYRYVWVNGAESPRPTVILRWNGEEYLPDLSLMRGRSVDLARLEKSPAAPPPAAEGVVREQWRLSRFACVMGVILDLIYAGRGDEALALLDAEGATPLRHTIGDRTTFDRAFQLHMGSSPFAPDIAALNADQPRFRAWFAERHALDARQPPSPSTPSR